MEPANDAEVGSAFKGKKNIYVCETCFGHIVTVDVDAGVTPFLIRCEAMPNCKGRMKSSLYRVFDQSIKASYEWYRPTSRQTLTGNTLDHVLHGGLLLRKALAS